MSKEPNLFELKFWGGFATQNKKCLAQNSFAAGLIDIEIENYLNALASTNSLTMPHKYPLKSWVSIFHLNRKFLARASAISMLGAGAVLISILCTQKILDSSAHPNMLIVFACTFIICQLILLATKYFCDLIQFKIQSLTQVSILNEINQKLLTINTTENFSAGNIKTIVASDLGAIEEFLGTFVSQALPFVVSVIVLVPYIVYTMQLPGLLAVLIALLQIPISIFISFYLARAHDKSQTKQDHVNTLTGEWLRNMRLAKCLSWQQLIQKDLQEGTQQMISAVAWKHTITCFIFGLSFCWWMIPIGTLIAASYYLNTKLNTVVIFASVWLLNHLSNEIKLIPYAITCYATANIGLKRIQKFLDAPDLIFQNQVSAQNNDFLVSTSNSAGMLKNIHLKNICLTLNGNQIFDHLNLSFCAAQSTAIIGTVGSGKTLLLRILAGECTPQSGSIEIEFANGEIRNLWQKNIYDAYRAQMAYVPQEPFLSNTSFSNNISLDTQTLPESVMNAAYAAELKADVSALEHGFEQEIGEAGINLSGGQKQRVSLARALHSKRLFALLDDPLSAVDTHTEKKLMNTFLNSFSGFILVSHRLGELYNVERIIVLENGKVAEDTTGMSKFTLNTTAIKIDNSHE